MAEFSSMRASVTGSAVPMHSYSYGSSENGDSGNVYVDLDAVNNVRQETEEEAEGAGNTVTFGGVETFATNSAAGSTIGAVTEGRLSYYPITTYSMLNLCLDKALDVYMYIYPTGHSEKSSIMLFHETCFF